MAERAKEFMDIALKQKKFKDEYMQGYHVYKDAQEFVLVEADAATEAIEKSGVNKPYKVVRSSQDVGAVIAALFFEDIANENAEATPKAAPDAPAGETALEASTEAAEAESAPQEELAAEDVVEETVEETPPTEAETKEAAAVEEVKDEAPAEEAAVLEQAQAEESPEATA